MTPLWGCGGCGGCRTRWRCRRSVRLALAVCRLHTRPSAQSPSACSSQWLSSGWRQKVGQRQGFRRPDIFPTSDPQTANHAAEGGNPRLGRVCRKQRPLPGL